MSGNAENTRIKLPHRGLTVTVSSRHLGVPAGSSDDRREEITERNWREFANCRGRPTSMFFLRRTDPKAKTREAKAVCDACPVKRRCLALALEHGEKEDVAGIFGGTSPNERRPIRSLLRSDPNYLHSQEATERYGLNGAY
jgi:WhiB family redox-sensing transcriptional regulator